MKRKKGIGVLIILLGVIVLLYKDVGFYGWGGYVDNSLENIIISLIIIIIGVLIMKKSKKTN